MTMREDVKQFLEQFKAEDLKKTMASPFEENAVAVLRWETDRAKYRGEEYQYTSYWYECEATGERFTTEETDAVGTEQVYDQYRIAHSIPTVEEIRALRKRCGLSATKMSALLGLGTNQYRLYEDGEMPSLSIGKILFVLCHSEETLNFYLTISRPQPKPYGINEEEENCCVAEPVAEYTH